MLNNRAVLLTEAQELAARYAGTGLSPDSLWLLTTVEIVGVLAYLKRLHSKHIGIKKGAQ